MALRYFKEKSPLLHVIGAGSLLEFVLDDEDFSFPVGRVQFIYVRPLSFKEFLIANNTLHLPNLIENASLKAPIDAVVHDHLIKYIKQYFLVGGMPALIAAFLRTKSFLKSKEVQAIILQTYQNDFGKYAKKNLFKYLELLFEKVPNLIGQQFKYSKVDPEAHGRELKKAIRLLNRAGVIHTVHSTSGSGIPLKFHRNEQKYKLLFLDIGLIQQANQIDPEQIWSGDLTLINSGMLAEQFVGQELLNLGEFYEEKELFFWEREKMGSDAEVDYIMSYKSHIIPIEVKAGKSGRLRSIKIFMEEKNSLLGIRISQKPLSFEENILTVPFYMIQQIPRLIEEVLRSK
jgi:predicted AAA+ superfamily ATPase